MDFDSYLGSKDALRQTKTAMGTVLHPGQLLDGMRVVAFLGRGSTSEVWRVHDLQQDRDYALKIFAPGPNSPKQTRQRFLTEARALDEFRHPNLMRRYQLQESGAQPYFTMDVLHPLPECLNQHEILMLLDDVLAGLEALHDKGIIHRDLKPSNILLDDTGHAVLTDLGVAHITDANLAKRLGNTDTPNKTFVLGSPFVGTPRYAAPEQIACEDVTPATDIYALGAVIEELFNGNVPLRWRSLLKRMTQARPGFRLSSVRHVRRHLSIIRHFPWFARLLTTAAAVLALVLTWQVSQPNWVEVSNTPAEIITLDGGHYFQRQMHFQPIAEPPSANALSGTNAIERQFQKMFATRYKRRPIYIQGKGTLKCPDVTSCEVHLASGVTFITSGRFKPDGFVIKEPVPPHDADWNSHIGYPAYVIETGAKLIFTENDAYPPALIR